jgi:transcriptional regulator with XRE-family HTH domain
MPIKTVGRRLLKLRKNLELTQKEFAQKVPGKVDYTYIGKIERGEQYPSLKMLEKIAKAFSVPLGYFFEDETVLHLLNLLPSEIKNLIQDKERQHLLKLSQRLSQRDLGLITQIVNILTQEKPLPGLAVAEPTAKYKTKKKRSQGKSQ